MNKIIVLGIAVLMAFGFAACTPHNLAEQMIEQAARQQGEDVDVDIDGDSITIQNEDEDVHIDVQGDSMSVSNDEEQVNINGGEGVAWPGDKLPANVPEVPGVSVAMVVDANGGVMVSFEGCDQTTADAYIATLKSKGWKAVTEASTEDGYMVIFGDSDESLMFAWSKEENTGSITYGQN